MKELWSLFWAFLKIGTCTFGGGYAMIPAIRYEFVWVRKTVPEEVMLDYIAICQSVPGPLAVNMALLIGMRIRKLPGAFAAALGMILPAVVSILLICILLKQVPEDPRVTGALQGVTGAAVAMILSTAVSQGKKVLNSLRNWILMLASFALIVFLGRSAAWSVVLGGIAGLLSWIRNRKKGEKA